jgi:hypothetical protein
LTLKALWLQLQPVSGDDADNALVSEGTRSPRVPFGPTQSWMPIVRRLGASWVSSPPRPFGGEGHERRRPGESVPVKIMGSAGFPVR